VLKLFWCANCDFAFLSQVWNVSSSCREFPLNNPPIWFQVKAPADSTADSEAPLPEQISLVLSELHGASGLSPRSKRLLAALAEAATAELTPSATATRLRRAAFWGKVRVAVLAATVAAVAVADVALAAYLYARRANDRFNVMPPT
jgi:hypothetical protein